MHDSSFVYVTEPNEAASIPRPGFLAGLGYGAIAGMFTALGALVVLIGSFAAELAIDDSQGGDDFTILVLFAYFGMVVAAVLGLIGGSVVGGLLGAARSSAVAPWLAAVLSTLIGLWMGQDIVDDGQNLAGRSVVFGVMVALFAGCGWLGGRWFAKRMQQ